MTLIEDATPIEVEEDNSTYDLGHKSYKGGDCIYHLKNDQLDDIS